VAPEFIQTRDRSGVLGLAKRLDCGEFTAAFGRGKLIVAAAKIALGGDGLNGWTLSIDQSTTSILGFLKANMRNRVYMALSYWAD
jgi:hypothetical protein